MFSMILLCVIAA